MWRVLPQHKGLSSANIVNNYIVEPEHYQYTEYDQNKH